MGYYCYANGANGKRRYSDREIAMADALSVMEKRIKDEIMYVYRCEDCHGWHVTKSDTTGKRFRKLPVQRKLLEGIL